MDRLKLNKSRSTAPCKHQTEVLTSIFYRECLLTELRTNEHLAKQTQKKRATDSLPVIYHSRPRTFLSPRSSCSTPCQYLGAKSDVLKVRRYAHASPLKKSTVSSRECINLVVHTSEGWLRRMSMVRSACSDSASSTKQTSDTAPGANCPDPCNSNATTLQYLTCQRLCVCPFDDKNSRRLGVRKNPLASLRALPFSACKVHSRHSVEGQA